MASISAPWGLGVPSAWLARNMFQGLSYLQITCFRYTEQDFALSGGIAVKEIFTTSDDLPDNNLVTFLEDVRIQMAARSSLRYRRLNHKDFSFHIKLSNPQREKRKVIVRIFLGLKSEGGDTRLW